MTEDGGSPRELPYRKRQREKALAKAEKTRIGRAKIRAGLKAREIDPIKLIRGEYPEYEENMATWKLDSLLKSVPQVGTQAMLTILMTAEMSANMQLRVLSQDRRNQLARLTAQATARPYEYDDTA